MIIINNIDNFNVGMLELDVSEFFGRFHKTNYFIIEIKSLIFILNTI